MSNRYTEIPMQPIDHNEARSLGNNLTDIGISDNDRKDLIMLICGIAAIDNPINREEVAAEAVHAIYLNLDGIFHETGAFVARIYKARRKGGVR
jgi:hypothetical protein